MEIIRYPNQLLKEISSDIDINNKDQIITISQKLIKALKKNPGVGVAAVQLGITSRIFIMDSSYNKKFRDTSSGQIIFINPCITKKTGSQIFREGCLSVPEYTANISRANEVTVEYFDQNLTKQTNTFQGFEAVIIQHEYDHLDGILFLDRIQSNKNLFKRN